MQLSSRVPQLFTVRKIHIKWEPRFTAAPASAPSATIEEIVIILMESSPLSAYKWTERTGQKFSSNNN